MSGARPDTWMPFYIGDYLADASHLTTEQHGTYILLLFACWRRNGLLPPDHGQLANIVHLTVAKWKTMLPAIAPFFEIADDGWRQKRVTKELAKAQAAYERASRGGKERAAKHLRVVGDE